MLNITDNLKIGGTIQRRDFLRVGTLGVAGLTLADWFKLQAKESNGKAKATSVIQIWLAGGPCHLDTFDPKPRAGKDYTGPYRKPISSNVKGIQLGQKLPMLAKQADKFSLIRGMTHGNNGHETATYLMQTGTFQGGELVYPSLGAVVALKKEAQYKGTLPSNISLTTPLGRFSAAGFLGPKYKPFSTGGDPAKEHFSVEGIVSQLSEKRLRERRTLLHAVDGFARKLEGNAEFAKMDRYQEEAYKLLLGDAKKAFDLTQEKDKLRERYGKNKFGQSCLLARRLVEKGIPFITINSRGWDTHKKHFPSMEKKLPELDQGLSALLEDLAQRGLLKNTIVMCGGEFGRTPKILWAPPWNGGRSHFGAAFSYLVAGGGFNGGEVVGSTDMRGETVTDRPVYPWDLSATIYQLLGIDPRGTLPHPRGCVAYVTQLANSKIPSGGILKEII